MTKNLTVRLDDELAADTEALARAEGQSLNETVKTALERGGRASSRRPRVQAADPTNHPRGHRAARALGEVTRYVDLVDYVAIAAEVTGLDEATVMKVANLDLADSALHAPAAGFGDTDLYPDFIDKAAMLIVRLGAAVGVPTPAPRVTLSRLRCPGHAPPQRAESRSGLRALVPCSWHRHDGAESDAHRVGEGSCLGRT